MQLKRRRLQSNLKQIEHDLTVFVARALAILPAKTYTPESQFIFNPYQKEIQVQVELDDDCSLRTKAICPICKEMIVVESIAKRQSKGMKYRFKSSAYIGHVKNHLE